MTTDTDLALQTHPLATIDPAPLSDWLRIIDKMVDKGVGADILTQVFALQKEAQAEMARKAFVKAFAAFKAVAPAAIERTGSVGYTSKKTGENVGYTHCELDVACETLTPILSKHGLAHSWEVSPVDDKGWINVACRLEHVEGHSRSVSLRGQPDTSGNKNAIQAVGSTIYYLERYTFFAVIGMAQKGADNDAQAPMEFCNHAQCVRLNYALDELREMGAVSWANGFMALAKKHCRVPDTEPFSFDAMSAAEFPWAMGEIERKRKSLAVCTPLEVQTLKGLIESSGADAEKFISHFGAASLETFPKVAMGEATRLLLAKKEGAK